MKGLSQRIAIDELRSSSKQEKASAEGGKKSTPRLKHKWATNKQAEWADEEEHQVLHGPRVARDGVRKVE